ncbi:MAG: DUF4386 domain-containing protein [Solirubrobacterales bacterium]|nr:DUF4386 domain-containing protein [Solirubrobacterales bacterium]
MTDAIAAGPGVPTGPDQWRRTSLIAGLLFIGTFVTSIAGLLLYDPILNDTDYVLGGGLDSQISLGALFEVFLVITNIGTAVVLFPLLKRQSEAMSLGYVASRVVESTIIAVGLISLMALVTLRDEAGGADPASLTLAGQSLVALHDWTFLLGPGFCVGIGNGLILGWLMYRSGLMPPKLAMFGLVGGPLIFLSSIAILFGAYEQTDGIAFLFSIPEIVWELSLAIYLTFRGFRSESPLLAAS